MKKLLLVAFFPMILFGQEPGDFDYTFRNLDSALAFKEAVYRLDLSKQKLEEFPNSIFTFQNLEYLDLSKNKLSQIPLKISELKKLRVLSLVTESEST